MEILDGTVIAPAAPLIAADLGIRAVDVNVAISGYLVTVAVLIPISGWAADRFGTRRVFATAIVLFTLASAGCALAPDLATLTVTRVLQGVGGALMVPVGRLAVLRATAKADLIKAIAYLTWPALLAPVLAPAIGGVLSEYASWRWIFVINVPLGIAGLLLVRRLVPDLRAERHPAAAGPARVRARGGRHRGADGRRRERGRGRDRRAVRRRGRRTGRRPARRRRDPPAARLGAAARPAHPAHPQLPGHGRGRLGVPDGDHRDPVPAAAAVPARVRVERGPGRPGGDRAVRGQRRDQAGDDPADAALRAARGAARVDPRVGPVPARDRGAHGVDAAAAADRAPGAERGVPVGRLLRLQQPGVRRRGARSHDAGQHADDHAAGARRRAGRRGGRAAAAAG